MAKFNKFYGFRNFGIHYHKFYQHRNRSLVDFFLIKKSKSDLLYFYLKKIDEISTRI